MEQLVALAERSTLQMLEGASELSELQLLHVLTQAASGCLLDRHYPPAHPSCSSCWSNVLQELVKN